MRMDDVIELPDKVLPLSHGEFVNREAALRGIQPSELEKQIETENIFIYEYQLGSAQYSAYKELGKEAEKYDFVVEIQEQSSVGLLGLTREYTIRAEGIKFKK